MKTTIGGSLLSGNEGNDPNLVFGTWNRVVTPSINAKFGNMMPVYRKVRKEGPGNYRPISLTLVAGKLMEQIILSAITYSTTRLSYGQSAWVYERQVLLD